MTPVPTASAVRRTHDRLVVRQKQKPRHHHDLSRSPTMQPVATIILWLVL